MSFRGLKPFWCCREKRKKWELERKRGRERVCLYVFLCLWDSSQEALAYIELNMNARWSKGWMLKWTLLRFNTPFEHSQHYQEINIFFDRPVLWISRLWPDKYITTQSRFLQKISEAQGWETSSVQFYDPRWGTWLAVRGTRWKTTQAHNEKQKVQKCFLYIWFKEQRDTAKLSLECWITCADCAGLLHREQRQNCYCTWTLNLQFQTKSVGVVCTDVALWRSCWSEIAVMGAVGHKAKTSLFCLH